ncbi:MAG: BspA family leucine-rich repeat surface protein [Prevotella sp.]|nr:BspA family leucine-rich repeat surface protein [Prevotella sp.]
MKQTLLYNTFLVLTALLLCGTTMHAQEPYAVLSENNTVLTFYYDNDKAERGGLSVGPFYWPEVGWDGYSDNITTVVFDDSFADCTTLTSTAFWFFGCWHLTSIVGLEHLNTSSVTDMNCMFYWCHNLPSLDVSGFNTSNVTDMADMFAGCTALTSLDLSGFNTANVTDISGMFYRCTALTRLDLSGFNTANVTEMEYMFKVCPALQTIYAGDGWSTNDLEDGSGMFDGCTSLVGGKGTAYDADHIDHAYARIDGGAEAPGYFTYKATEGVSPVVAGHDTDAPVYSLSGQRLAAPHKGLNIVGGRKVIVK